MRWCLVLPLTDPTAETAVKSGDEHVYQTYQGLARYELAKLHDAAAALPAASAEATARSRRLAAVQATIDQFPTTPPAGRWLLLTTLAVQLDQANDQITGPGLPGKSLGAPTLTTKNNKTITEAMRLLHEQARLSRIGWPAEPQWISAAFERVFGSQASAARVRFQEVVALLEELWDRTNKDGKGFVHNSDLPTGMLALARRRVPAENTYIDLSTEVLDGTYGGPAFAAVLAHEGSHALAKNAAIDLLNRNMLPFAAYYLTGQLALHSASNFEQLVLELNLGPKPAEQNAVFPSDDAIATIRSRESVSDAVILLTKARIERAAVRLFQQTNRNFTDIAAAKRIAAYFPELPTQAPFPELVKAHLAAAYETVAALRQEQKRLATGGTGKDLLLAGERLSGPLVITFPETPHSVKDLAANLIQQLLDLTRPPSPTPLPNLLTFILSGEELENPEDGQLLTEFFASLSPDNKPCVIS